MKKTLIIVPLAALALAAPAEAATAYMSGLGGSQPGFSTITGPNGERVNTGWRIFGGDEQIRWNTVTQDDAVRAQIEWLEKHQNEDNVLWDYSASANSINKVAVLRPDLLTRTTVISIAPPRPGSLDYAAPPAGSTFKQYQVIVDGDSVADEDGKSFDTHLNGYKNLNLQTATPISSTVLHDTNTTRSYYQRPKKVSWLSLLFSKGSASGSASAAPAKPQEPTTTEPLTTGTEASGFKESGSAIRAATRESSERASARSERRTERKAARAERREARKAARADD